MRTVYLLARCCLARRSTRLIVALICVLSILLAVFAIGPAGTDATTRAESRWGPRPGTCCPQFPRTATAIRSPTPLLSPTPCPGPTATPIPAPLVEPLTSPTTALSQVITVAGIPGQWVSIYVSTGSLYPFTGTIDSSGYAHIEVSLAPNSTTFLQVWLNSPATSACNGESWSSTVNDRNGNELVIVQQSPPTPTLTPTPVPSCQVRYSFQSQWQDGFVADVWIKNIDTVAINGWTLAWMFSGDQRISNMWNAGYTQTGSGVSARNAAWNPTIAPGATVSLGFQASYSGINSKPTGFTLNGRTCSVQE